MKRVLFILGQLSDTDSEWLAQNGDLVRVPPGRELVAEGSAVDSLYIVIDGELEVSTASIGRIAQLGPGEVVGEMSLVDSRPATASVVASSSAALLRLAKRRVRDKIEADTGFGLRFYKAIAMFLADRMRSTYQRGSELAVGAALNLDEDTETEGELDLEVLDNLYLAGTRFERIFKSMLGGPATAA